MIKGLDVKQGQWQNLSVAVKVKGKDDAAKVNGENLLRFNPNDLGFDLDLTAYVQRFSPR